MKTLILGLAFLFQLSSASAQTIDVAHRFPGYAPSVIESEAQAKSIFKGMEDSFKMIRPWKLQFGSECTQRAETWTFDLNRTQGLNTQKVFVFYTKAYHQYYRQKHQKKFIWWFHVSPYILVNGANGLEERVMDKTFADQPQTMKEWTDIFIESKEPCIENVPYANFEGDVTGTGASYNASAHCYIVRAPMYDMYPGDIDARERGQKSGLNWDLNQVEFASKSLPAGARKDFYKRTGL